MRCIILITIIIVYILTKNTRNEKNLVNEYCLCLITKISQTMTAEECKNLIHFFKITIDLYFSSTVYDGYLLINHYIQYNYRYFIPPPVAKKLRS